MDDGWISAARAFDLLSRVLPYGQVGDAVFKRARSGQIGARARAYVVDGQRFNDVEVPADFWGGFSDGLADNWATGDFDAILDSEMTRAAAFGVEFWGPDITAIVPAPKAEATPSPGRRRGDFWADWTAELVARIHEHGMPAGQGAEGQQELINAVADALMARGIEPPGRTTVQPIVQAVLSRLRKSEK